MRLESIKGLATAGVAAGFLLYNAAVTSSFGDEPSRLGRFFRMGSSTSTATTTPGTSSSTTSTAPAPSYLGQPALSTPPSTASGSSSMISPKVTPRPRINKPITEADPLVTRISLGRSDTGSQFGMLLQVFADGTIIDGEGVHRVSPEALRPVVDAVASGDLAKLKGHCGGPAGDFIENVHVVVFERSLGRLRANSFSYSGNPQGCEHAVIHLQKALDELQAKLSPMNPTATPTSNSPAPGQVLTTPLLPLTSP